MVGHVQSCRSTSLRRVIMLSSKDDEESSSETGVYKPLYREKTVYVKTHKTAINRPLDHTRETEHTF